MNLLGIDWSTWGVPIVMVSILIVMLLKQHLKGKRRLLPVAAGVDPKESNVVWLRVALDRLPNERRAAGRVETKIDSAPAATPSVPRRRPIRFLIDAVLLATSYHYVCRSRRARGDGHFKEVFHWAAGFPVDKTTYVITQLVPVDFSRQSAGGCTVETSSNVAALERIDAQGLVLLASFHSHPGAGRNANHPSPTDRDFQERLERGGHVCISGIFSQDGFLRFFAGDLDRFVLEVVGHGVKKVGDNEFLVDRRNVSDDSARRLPGFRV